jgi:hypothetical protein
MLRLRACPGLVGEGAVEEERPPQALGTTREGIPDWWPYEAEFPHWHVWRGVGGLVYARRPRTSPPIVLRAADAKDLRDQISRAEGKMA